jgi:hypothetical protein
MKHRIVWVCCLVVLFCQPVSAQRRMKQMDADKQEEEDRARAYEATPWYDKISFGGNVGAAFGSGYSSVLLQPLVFYRFTEKTMAGTGFTYYYWSQKYILGNGQTKTISDNAYGYNLFARQMLFNPVFAHVEWNPMNFTYYNRFSGEEKRIWKNSLYVGGGIQQSISGRGGFYIMALYDLLWDQDRSFYPIPYDFRVGFFF